MRKLLAIFVCNELAKLFLTDVEKPPHNGNSSRYDGIVDADINDDADFSFFFVSIKEKVRKEKENKKEKKWKQANSLNLFKKCLRANVRTTRDLCDAVDVYDADDNFPVRTYRMPTDPTSSSCLCPLPLWLSYCRHRWTHFYCAALWWNNHLAINYDELSSAILVCSRDNMEI